MEEDEDHYTRMYSDKIQSNIWETMGFIRLVGEMVTMFVPRVFDVFVMAAGGRGDDNEHRSFPTPPSADADGPADPGKIAPKAPDDPEL